MPTPPLRLWTLGVDVDVTDTDGRRLLELPGGRVLEFDVVRASSGLQRVVLTTTERPALILW
jgi:hypothetical protein